MLRRTIGLKDFGKSYNSLFGLGIIIFEEVLKCKSQNLNLKHVLVILIILAKHNLSLVMYLRYLHDNLSEPEVDELLHLTIALMNSSSEKDS